MVSDLRYFIAHLFSEVVLRYLYIDGLEPVHSDELAEPEVLLELGKKAGSTGASS